MKKNCQKYSKHFKLSIRTFRRAEHVNDNRPLEQLITRSENGFFQFVKNNIASATNYTSTMIDVDSLNDFFANNGRNWPQVQIVPIWEIRLYPSP